MTPHLSLSELTHTDTQLDNFPSDTILLNLKMLALGLEDMRSYDKMKGTDTK